MNPGIDEDSFATVLETVARFTRERLVPAERTVEETDDVPADIVAEMRELGLFGLSIPRDYGGLGLSLAQELEVVAEIGKAALAFRSVFGTNVGIGSQGIVIDGTDAQKQAWLPRLATGEAVASFALTEPDAGSDAASIRTRAERDGDHFVINGAKRYITNASRATMLTLLARTGGPGASGISAFVVPAAAPGVTIGGHDRKMGQRGTRTCDIAFDNVRVPEDALIGGPANLGRGFRTAMKVLDRGRIHMAGLAIGQARRLMNEMCGYGLQRRQFGSAIADFQLVQAMIADSETELLAATALTRAAASSFDHGARIAREAACAKLFATEAVGRIADRAVQIFGGAGYMAEYPVERIYRDVRLMRIYEGTSQIQQLIIAKSVLGGYGNGERH